MHVGTVLISKTLFWNRINCFSLHFYIICTKVELISCFCKMMWSCGTIIVLLISSYCIESNISLSYLIHMYEISIHCNRNTFYGPMNNREYKCHGHIHHLHTVPCFYRDCSLQDSKLHSNTKKNGLLQLNCIKNYWLHT